MESPTTGAPLAYLLFACAAIQIVIGVGDFVKYIFKIVSFGTLGLKSVGFYD